MESAIVDSSAFFDPKDYAISVRVEKGTHYATLATYKEILGNMHGSLNMGYCKGPDSLTNETARAILLASLEPRT